MVNKILNAFKPSRNSFKTPQGSAGYDNARENIDPHIKTNALDAKEMILSERGLLLVKNARVNRHIRVGSASMKLGGSSPTAGFIGVFPSLSFSQAISQEAHFQLIVPHRWDTDTDMEICFDWLYTGAQDNGTVKWGLEYNAMGEGEDPTTGSVTISCVSPGNHTTAEIQRCCITTKILKANMAPEDVFGMRIFRDRANDTLNTGAILLGIHIHYILNKLGGQL